MPLCFSGSMNPQEFLQTISDRLANSATVKAVYGEPVAVGNRTVIPVAHICYGFGGGGGEQKGEKEGRGGGGGGGVLAKPCGALEVTPEGTRFIAFPDNRRVAFALAMGFLLGAIFGSSRKRRRY